MAINLLHITFDMGIGGTEQVISNLIESVDKSKIKVSILCLEHPLGPLGKILKEKGYQVDTIPRKKGFDLKLIFKIRRYLIKHKINVIHCHQYTPWVYGVFGSFFIHDIKVIFTEHGRFYPDQSSFKRRIVNPFLVAMTDHIIAISEATKKALIEYEFIPASKIKVIYNGINSMIVDSHKLLSIKQDLNIPDNAVILGTIARLDPIKNHKLLISAFYEIHKSYPNTLLIIVGDGETRSYLEKLTEELGLTEKVLFMGYKTNPAEYLQLMDIFLLPSLSEGTSITLLESMSLAKACIVTNVGGNPEIIENHVSGIVTPSNDKSKLVESISLLLKDENLRERIGTACRERFSKNFSVNSMIKKYQEIYF
jgi:glycosyltransferase involved in cell wall biosynthesis